MNIEKLNAVEDLIPKSERRSSPLAQIDSDNSFGLYMAEAGAAPLLSHEQVLALAKIRDVGRDAKVRLEEQDASGKHIFLSDEEHQQLLQSVFDGEAAKDQLIRSNARLVIHQAKKYQSRGVLTLLDLIQEGNLGLMKAVDKFDPERGTQFSTYATYWIKQNIIRAIADQSRTIRVPVHATEHISRLKQVEQKLLRTGQKPTIKAIVEEAGIEGMTPDRALALLIMDGDLISLDKPVGEDSDTALGDSIESEQEVDPDNEFLREDIEEALRLLSEKQRQVLVRRYGLDGGAPETLAEIGDELGVTRERVRQIEIQAIRRLKHPTRSAKLREYFRSR